MLGLHSDFFGKISIICEDASKVAEFIYWFHLFTIINQFPDSMFIVSTSSERQGSWIPNVRLFLL